MFFFHFGGGGYVIVMSIAFDDVVCSVYIKEHQQELSLAEHVTMLVLDLLCLV